MDVRLATLEDIPQLQKLIALSVRGLSKSHYTTFQIESALKYIFGVDTQLIIDSTYYLVETGRMIVGCGGWSKRNTLFGGDQHKEKADPLLNPLIDPARIRAFFVHPEYARQGIGRQIINVCESAALAEGFSSFELGATLPGVPLYTIMGYYEMEKLDVKLPDDEFLTIVKMGKKCNAIPDH